MLVGCATTQTTKGGLVPYAAAGVSNQVAEGRRIALVIGTDQYEDDLYTDLRYAEGDARAVALALTGFDHVALLATPEETTQAAILDALERLKAEVRSPTDTVLIYVSGHGTLARPAGGELERFIVTSDAVAKTIDRSGIAVSEVVRLMESLPSRRKGVVLATCYNGQSKSALSDALAAELASQKGALPPLMQRSEAMIVASAASWGEAAIEDSSLGHDVYTWFLLEGLREGDRDLDGAVTLTEAHDYARDRTYGFTQGRQRPSARAVVLGRDPIVLAGDPSGAPPPMLYSYDESGDGLTVVLDGQTKGALPGGVPVDVGVHRLELLNEDGQLVHTKRVRLAHGDRVSLTELVLPRSEVSIHAGAHLWAPIGASRQAWPMAVGPALEVAWHPAKSRAHLLANGSVLLGEPTSVAEQWRMASGQVGFAWSVLEHPVFDLRPQVRLGLLHAAWTFPFGWDTQALGTGGSTGLQFSTRPFAGAEVLVDGQFGLTNVDLTQAQLGAIHPDLRGNVSVGWRF